MIGPYPSQDHKCGVMIAKPIPPGSTVIAKPVIPGKPSTAGSTSLPLSIPSQFLPSAANANTFAPKAMIWNNQFPDGQLVPLRQPEPAVYFFQQQKAIH